MQPASLVYAMFARGKKHRFSAGFLVSVLLVGLSVVCMVGISGVLSGYQRAVEKLLYSYYPHIWIRAKAGFLRDADVRVILDALDDIGGLSEAAPAVIIQGSPVKVRFGETSRPYNIVPWIYGIDFREGRVALEVDGLLDRDALERLREPNVSVVVSADFYKNIRNLMNDNPPNEISFESANAEIVDVVNAPLAGGADFILTDLRNVQEILNLRGRFTDLQYSVGDFEQIADAAAKVRESLSTTDFVVFDLQSEFEEKLAVIRIQNVMIYAIVTQFVVLAAIANSFFLYFLVMTRKREIAMLRCSGVGSKLVNFALVRFNLTVCFAGFVTGGPLGALLARALVDLLGEHLKKVFFIDRLSVEYDAEVLTIFGFSVLVLMGLASLIPISAVRRMSPAAELRMEQ